MLHTSHLDCTIWATLRSHLECSDHLANEEWHPIWFEKLGCFFTALLALPQTSKSCIKNNP